MERKPPKIRQVAQAEQVGLCGPKEQPHPPLHGHRCGKGPTGRAEPQTPTPLMFLPRAPSLGIMMKRPMVPNKMSQC